MGRADDGRLTTETLAAAADRGDVDTVIVGFTDPYGRLAGKRCDVSFFLDDVVGAGTHACDYLLTADMEMEPVPGYQFANWAAGYGDVHLAPDLATLRVADWLDRTAIVLCDVADPATHQPVTVAPRSILRRQVDAASATGHQVMAATELEYYLFRTSYRDAHEQGHVRLDPANHYIEDYQLLAGSRTEDVNGAARRHLSRSGVPVESSKGEWGTGQHELNVRYAEVVEMADRHVLLKQCVKETADRFGMSATFMAKPVTDWAGSSCHVHLSLWRDGVNAFDGDQQVGRLSCSDEFRWFLGGVLAHLPEVMVFYAPTVNSYKRYVDGSWAPTRVAWSYDNRTAGVRVVGQGPSLRIECRVPGADCNPYLALAGLLATGLAGIADQVDPPAAFDGDIYGAAELPGVPRSLDAATDAFAASSFAAAAFGADVVEHYTHFFRTESAAFAASVTDWERARYFERI
ncbi:MAG TPA: glutamine synthetase family protein [Acidimicrobiales bacterium]|nr:glutamine synthetase family protein [Acidimicrobiales bacterium]